MNAALVDRVAQAVMYEGYILYPYRRSVKNQHRWTFGGLFPRDYVEASGRVDPAVMQSQCLLHAKPQTRLTVSVRFLQLVDRQVHRLSNGKLEAVESLEVAGRSYQSWQEAVERTVTGEFTPGQSSEPIRFGFPAGRTSESLGDAGLITRTQQAIEGQLTVSLPWQWGDIYHVEVRIHNLTPIAKPASLSRCQAQVHSMASTHAVLSLTAGQFVSAIDPPPELAELSRACRNVGCFPVLVGEPGATDAMLASPIILYDYPQIAPESPGDLFDAAEIDEILSLRIMTLSDDEKRAVADLDPRGASLLQRTESIARDRLMDLHGTMRPPRKVEVVHVGDTELRAGDRVRLRPRRSADAFDLILAGKTATIVAIEQDYENRLHVAVTIDDDPGAEIGAAGKIGHRFFYGLDEIEPLAKQEAT